MKKCPLGLEPDACCGHKLRLAPLEVNTRVHPLRFQSVSQPIGVRLIEGRQRAEDLRRLAAGEVTPEELRRENSFIRSAWLFQNRSPWGSAPHHAASTGMTEAKTAGFDYSSGFSPVGCRPK